MILFWGALLSLLAKGASSGLGQVIQGGLAGKTGGALTSVPSSGLGQAAAAGAAQGGKGKGGGNYSQAPPAARQRVPIDAINQANEAAMQRIAQARQLRQGQGFLS